MGKRSSKFFLMQENTSQLETKEIRKKRKEDRKNAALGLAPKTSAKNKVKAPQLAMEKKSILQDLEKKKKTSSRVDLINQLKNKMEQQHNFQSASVQSYKFDAESKRMIYDETNDSNIAGLESEMKLNRENRDMSKRAFIKDLKQVVENSDVVLEVLDVRDPLSCRSPELEAIVRGQKDEKRLILILNKVDLVPIENALCWQTYFMERLKIPSVIFKANTQVQSANLSSSSLYKKAIVDKKDFIEEMINSNKSVGSEKLIELLKNYCRLENGGKRAITVGVVGYPNVGKSSIINSLRRGKVAGVSSTPGHTKGMQEIVLDGDIKLLDSPGVVLAGENEDTILHNVIRIEDIKDPIEVVGKVMRKVATETLIKLYALEGQTWNSIEQFLYLLGEKYKKYKKGGVIDFDKVARIVIRDWYNGNIKYFTLPPDSMNFSQEFEMK